MPNTTFIEHQGTIVEINDGFLKVQVEVIPACGSCQARENCMMAEDGYRYLEVVPDGQKHEIGDHVTVVSRQSQSYKAVVWAYLLPFICLVSALVIAHELWKNEFLAGVVAGIVLLGYYFLLYLFRDRLKQEFTFTLKQEL